MSIFLYDLQVLYNGDRGIMGYLHIDNLYKNQTILLFKECFALEKIHGTSAHITWKEGRVNYFSGGERLAPFLELFDDGQLRDKFISLGHGTREINVYGEAYGAKQQGQSWRYGKTLKFVVFDVKIGDHWLDVPNAEDVASKLGLEFVHYKKIKAEIQDIDVERDAPSFQAKRNGVEGDKPREGVVLRPLYEMFLGVLGGRVIVKHKRDDERETRSPRSVDPDKQKILDDAKAIADEWVTQTRLEHVLDKLGQVGVEDTAEVIVAMIEDITREAAGEIVDSKAARKTIGTATARLFKAHVKSFLNNSGS